MGPCIDATEYRVYEILPVPFEMGTKYADFPVTTIIEVSFVYLRREISTSEVSELFSAARFLDLDVSKLFILPPLAVKDICNLFRGLCVLGLPPLEVKYTPLSLLLVLLSCLSRFSFSRIGV